MRSNVVAPQPSWATAPAQDSESRSYAPLKRMIRSAATTLILVFAGFAMLVLFAELKFGSAAGGLAYLRGDRLIPDAYAKSFGRAALGERPSIDFSLRNWRTRPIMVLGAKSSCSCVIANGLPVLITPNGEVTITILARARAKPGPFRERLRVITDCGEPGPVLTAHGVFR